MFLGMQNPTEQLPRTVSPTSTPSWAQTNLTGSSGFGGLAGQGMANLAQVDPSLRFLFHYGQGGQQKALGSMLSEQGLAPQFSQDVLDYIRFNELRGMQDPTLEEGGGSAQAQALWQQRMAELPGLQQRFGAGFQGSVFTPEYQQALESRFGPGAQFYSEGSDKTGFNVGIRDAQGNPVFGTEFTAQKDNFNRNLGLAALLVGGVAGLGAAGVIGGGAAAGGAGAGAIASPVAAGAVPATGAALAPAAAGGGLAAGAALPAAAGGGLLSGMGGLSGALSTAGKFLTSPGGQAIAGSLANMYAGRQQQQIGQQTANTLMGMFGQNSPYAQNLRKELEARDAAAGRRSQYGPREVELQAKLATMAAQIATPSMNAALTGQGGQNQIIGELLKIIPNIFSGSAAPAAGTGFGSGSQFGNQDLGQYL